MPKRPWSELFPAVERLIERAERMLDTDRDPAPTTSKDALAYRWRAGRIEAIEFPDLFPLDSLIGVERSIAKLRANTEAFTGGAPALDVLLYGERGTGKSSAVRGLLREFGPRGFRLVDLAELQVVEAAVGTLPAHELIVGAGFHDSAIIQHEDLVSIPYRRESVRDDDDGSIGEEPVDRTLDEALRLAIQRRGGLIEDEDGRVAQYRTGDGDPLALPTGETHTSIAEHSVVALGGGHDELMRVRGSCGRFDLLLTEACERTVGDVSANGVVENYGLLRDDAHQVTERVQSDLAYVDPVQRYTARNRFVKSR